MNLKLQKAISQLGTGSYKGGSSATKGWVYHSLPFPNCGHLKVHRPNAPDRWHIINRHTSFKGKRVLDLGCSVGYFSFMAQRAGASRVLGIDYDQKAIRVARVAVEVYDVKDVTFLHGTEELIDSSHEFDAAFSMSVLQWLGRERAEKFLEWAGRKVKELWLEIPIGSDGKKPARWLHSKQGIIDWTKKVSRYERVREMGKTHAPHSGAMRPLFRCWHD